MTTIPAIRTEIRDIGPDAARRHLSQNSRNRNLSDAVVERLSGAILRGEWRFNGDPIRFAADGRLLDGQHRLAAIVKTGATLKLLVITGLADESQETMDTGKKRAFADVLSLAGETNVATLAAAVRLIFFYSRFRAFNAPIAPTHQQLRATLEMHPTIRDALKPSRPTHEQTRLAGAPVTACFYLATLVDPAEAAVFFSQVADGVGLGATDPAYTLRRRYTGPAPASGRNEPASFQAALMIKAFNAFHWGESISQLKYSPTIDKAFPAMDGLPDGFFIEDEEPNVANYVPNGSGGR